jgi:hypothetical protein
MVIHTFFFRWKAGVTDAQKQRAQDEICALQTQIPGILETNVGVNFSPRSLGYEFAGVMKFADRATLKPTQLILFTFSFSRGWFR